MHARATIALCAFALALGSPACGGDDSGTDSGTDVPADVPADAPLDVPADTPADVPADTPTDVATDVPTDTPADTPTDTPADVPPSVCETYCGPVVAAGCAGGPPTEPACLAGCAAILAECPDAFAAVATCAGEAPTITCDAAGTPVATGCETEQAALMGCMMGGPCGRYCELAVAAECSGTPETFAQCSANCLGSESACPTRFAALSTCAGESFTVVCDAFGRVSVTGCTTEYDALMQCAIIDPCTALCPGAVDAECDSGPPTLASCVEGCGGVASEGCIDELHELASCAGAEPTFSCNDDELPIVDDCETEHEAFTTCGGLT
jgi:hypothetical protein